jgi:curved DNA-binding protein
VNFSSTNYYFRLGVSRGSSVEEIRRAFRSLARVYHPDVADNKTYAEEVFKHLNEAYETLSDDSRRRRYDQKLFPFTTPPPKANPFATPTPYPRPAPASPPPYSSSRTSASTANPFTPPPKPRLNTSRDEELPQPNHRADLDIEATLDITLEDAVQGATYVVTVQQNDLTNRRQNLHTCRVHVPENVYDGQRLRLRGLGYVDHQAFCIGDLYLTIRYAKHKQYRVGSTTLYTETQITPWEAALGARIRFPTLDGLADLHIPPGTQPGSYLRLPKHGLPQKEGGRGDMLICIRLRVPVATSEKERQLWRALASQQLGK